MSDGRLAVAVVIPAFDAARWIAEALESALAQSLAPAEVVVVDDGSRDGTAAIARGFEPRGVRVLAQANAGAPAARNRGIAATTAPLVALLDADDVLPLDRLARDAARLAADLSLDGVAGAFETFVSPEVDGADRARLERAWAGAGWVAGALTLRRAALERVGPFDERLRLSDFIDWADRARRAGLRIEARPEVALRRRVHPGSLSFRARGDAAGGYVDVARAALERRRRQ